jgi:hypothetical protein
MLKKTFAVAILVGLIGSIAFAQEHTDWTSFTSPEGRFTVLMPTKPELEIKNSDTPQGTLVLHLVSATSDNGYFLVSYNDYPNVDASNVQTALEAAQKGALESLGGDLISSHKISLGDNPGLEFSAKKISKDSEVSKDSEIIANARYYFVGRRLYQVLVLTYKAHADSPDIQKFLNSFQLAN